MSQYHELVIDGTYDMVRGFVTGFLSGRAYPTPAVFSRECGIRRVSLGEKMLAWTGVHGQGAHIIVEDEIVGDLIREITTNEAGLDLKVVSNRRIKNATFDFHYRVFARVYAEEIKTIFAATSSGVTVGFEEGPEEIVKPDAKGVEMYTPDHDFQFFAKGSISGGFAHICPLFEKLAEHPLVEVGEIHLEYEE